MTSKDHSHYPKANFAAHHDAEENDEDDSIDENETEDYHGAALNLLDIRDPNRWREGNHRISLGNLGDPARLSNSTGILPTVFTGAPNFLGINGASSLSTPRTVPSDGQNSESKGEFSITKYFEPKFMEIFDKYCESNGHPVDISKHLVSVCLENLISFCCWARESQSRSQWVKLILEDNVDLRPEVRNGLAMVLIYVFSSAQAQQGSDADMFTVLQDAETGMGIVNKTSLKIYNDPFYYFSFIKSCISGLIDAGKIPENERQNQPKKPKRTNENKDEIAAFIQLHQALAATLSRGDHNTARTKVQHVMTVWQQKQKGIRSRRFATALAVFSAPIAPASVASSMVIPGTTFSLDPHGIIPVTVGTEHLMIGPHGNLLAVRSAGPSASTTTAVVAGNVTTTPSAPGLIPATSSSDSGAAEQGFDAADHHNNHIALHNAAGLTPQHHSMMSQQDPSSSPAQLYGTNGNNPTNNTVAGTSQQGINLLTVDNNNNNHSNNSNNHNGLNGNDNVYSQLRSQLLQQNVTSTQQQLHHHHPPPQNQYQPPTKFMRTMLSSSAGSASMLSSAQQHHAQVSQQQQQQQLTPSSQPQTSQQQQQSASRSHSWPSVSVLRFERVGNKDWEYKEVKVYNLESLLASCQANTTFCLVDETKLSTEERLTKRLSTQTLGFVSLTNELQQRQSLVTSWSRSDHSHLLDFLESWLIEKQRQDLAVTDLQGFNGNNEGPLSLLDYWNRTSAVSQKNTSFLSLPPAGDSDQTNIKSNNQSNLNGNSTSGGGHSGHGSAMDVQEEGSNSNNNSNAHTVACGQGIIAYEVVMQVGIVLRQAPSLHVSEDCWRLLYPLDLHSNETLSMSFGHFLASFFPQLRSMLNHLSDLSSVVVKYYPHQLEGTSIMQPPRAEAVPGYQTIGTLDEAAASVLARFETSLSFHDIVLQAT